MASKIVWLNIGGVRFQTSRRTLGDAPDTCMLRVMIEPRWQNESSEEPLFVDRDATHFPVVLNFLRGVEPLSIPETVSELNALRVESEFYGLPNLTCIVDVELAAHAARTNKIEQQERRIRELELQLSRIPKSASLDPRDLPSLLSVAQFFRPGCDVLAFHSVNPWTGVPCSLLSFEFQNL